MVIGILKETTGENRVALLPEHVITLKKLNVSVIFESGAGTNASAPDSQYLTAGAEMLSRDEILNKANLIAVI